MAAGEIGGAERLVADLAAAPPPRSPGVDHAVAVFSPTAALGRWLRARGVLVHDFGPAPEHALGLLGRTFGPFAVRRLAALVRRERFGVVHVHTFASQVLGTRAARLARVPVVRTEHSTRVFHHRLCWPLARWSLRRAHRSVAVSNHVARTALAAAPWAAPRMRVIANGVAIPDGAAGPEPGPAGGGPFRFVAVGRLEPRKGLDLALDALRDVPGAVLDVVGDGQLRAALEARAAADPELRARVTFHGFRDDPAPLVAGAHAALSSSVDEGLPLGLLEAMAAARPVVAVPVGGIPEIVRHGETGWLARERSRRALAEVMRDAASDPERARRRGEAARADVRTRFSLAAMAAAYDEIYRELTRQNPWA
jgi:glycosyltransferase involved in cell wall biosynthesis